MYTRVMNKNLIFLYIYIYIYIKYLYVYIYVNTCVCVSTRFASHLLLTCMMCIYYFRSVYNHYWHRWTVINA